MPVNKNSKVLLAEVTIGNNLKIGSSYEIVIKCFSIDKLLKSISIIEIN